MLSSTSRGRGVSEASTVVFAHSSSKISTCLGYLPGLIVISCEADPAAVIELCRRYSPCILLADAAFIVNFPIMLRQELRKQGDRTLVMAIYSSEQCPSRELLDLGCSGVISGDASSDELRRAIDAILFGELYYPRKVLSDVIRSLLSPFEVQQLTRREKEILQMIAQGYSNGEIASALFISKETVRWHQRSLYSKIGTSNRKEMATFPKALHRAS